MRLNAIKIDDNFHQEATTALKRRNTYNEKEINAIYNSLPSKNQLYKYEPFEFYGGNFQASQIDK